MTDMFLIKKPWITEKATDLSTIGKYVFLVKNNATKNEIKKVIKQLYKVDVADVNTIRRPAKQKGKGMRFRGVESGYKKAIVTLKAGQTIALQ